MRLPAFVGLSCLLLMAACGSGQNCVEQDHTTCRFGEVFWVDSCGELGYRLQVCECGCNADGTGCEYDCRECERTADCTASRGPNYYCDLVSHECVCAPACTGKCCGDDGCGVACPDDCAAGTICDPDTCTCEIEGPCDEGQTRCEGDVVQVCDSEDWIDQEDCAAGGQICQAGACACVPTGDEVCNGLDDDCDGQTDEPPALVLQPESGAQAVDGIDNNCNGLVDEPGGVMVEVQGLVGRRAWIDVYEATVFETPGCTGIRYGEAYDDYPAEWPAEGPKQIDLYACSLPGLVPSGSLSRVRAKRACEAQGKRLCARSEYILACAQDASWYPWGGFSLPPGTCNGPFTGLGAPAQTGSFPNCTGDDLTFDMVGNLAEWISDSHADDPEMGFVVGWSYSRDICVQLASVCYEADLDLEQDAAILDDLTNCIVYNNHYEGFPPSLARADFGTRCCLDGP